ncbi:MAG: FAD-dependent 5-carboxymethylaminomethyl-2-thiouridine(34) oxidoreductase MnmC, partial [Amphiplicatus sp.]
RRAGLRPTIFDPEGLAAGASGNRAGLVMPRLDLGGGAGARFFLLSYLHTIRLLTSLSKDPSEKDLFNACGVLLGATRDEEHERHKKLLAENTAPPDHVRPHDRGLFFPQAGVVDPRKFVAALADGTSVIRRRVVAIERASLLEKGEESRLALRLDNHSRAACDAVVIANGTEALAFLEARALPLAAVAGQIDWFPKAAAPASALAFGPYAAPAPEGGLLIGATYRKGAAAVSRAASEENIRALAAFAPEIAARLDPADAIPRAAMRCQTPDRLPVAGPLPDLGFYAAAYEGLRDGRVASAPGRMIPGVFILSGLGSRGLVTAPLAAAMLIAEMTGAIAPLPADIAEALHPARFFIRDLKRTRKIRKA